MICKTQSILQYQFKKKRFKGTLKKIGMIEAKTIWWKGINWHLKKDRFSIDTGSWEA